MKIGTDKKEKEYIHLSVSKTKETFTINGCGKFSEEKKHLTRTEASLLYIELHKWLLT
jgi:hypothetical protein